MDYEKIKKHSAIIKTLALAVFAVVIVVTVYKKPEISPELAEYYRETDFTAYGGAGVETAWGFSKYHGGYIGAAATASFGAGMSDFYLMLFDKELNLARTRTFGTPENESMFAAIPDGKGGYIMAGGTDRGKLGESDGYIVRADSDGMQVWDGHFGGGNHDYLYSVSAAGQGAFVAAGYSSSFNTEKNSDGYLVKFDLDGNIVWDRTYGKEGWDIFYKVIQLKNGDFVAAGYTTSAGKGRSSMYFVRTDPKGKPRWAHTIGDVRDDRAISLLESRDGGLIILSNSTSYIARGFGWDMVLIKTDANLNPLWSKVFPACEAEPGASLIENPDGSIVFAGAKKCYGICIPNAYVVKTDNTGEMIWQRIFAAPQNDRINGIAKTDRGYALFGTTLSKGANGDIFLLHIDENGEKIK